MRDLINELDRNQVEGSLVEMGCGQGGCGAMMAHTTEQNGSDRKIFLFDSFEGLSEIKEEDLKGALKAEDHLKAGYLKVSEEMPKEALRAVGAKKPENVKVVKGWFEDTLPGIKQELGTIAILRLDADLYEPTLYCLEELWDQIADGGYVVVDDYKNWVGARRALYEFFYKHNINPYIQIYPYRGVAYFKKDGA